jgi:hypothetical protein
MYKNPLEGGFGGRYGGALGQGREVLIEQPCHRWPAAWLQLSCLAITFQKQNIRLPGGLRRSTPGLADLPANRPTANDTSKAETGLAYPGREMPHVQPPPLHLSHLLVTAKGSQELAEYDEAWYRDAGVRPFLSFPRHGRCGPLCSGIGFSVGVQVAMLLSCLA